MAIRGAVLTRIAGLAVVALALGAGATQARPVTLWACHGPLGQPLGPDGLAAVQAGDGRTSAAGACEGDGGVLATFSRPDPVGGSIAGWQAVAPPTTTLHRASVVRTIRPAGASHGTGTGQRYAARSAGDVLESVDLFAGPVPGPGLIAAAASGTVVTVGVDCPRPAGARCDASTAGAVTVDAIALDVDDATPPRGSVAGLRSPVSGALTLEINADDDGAGLATARALLDDAPLGGVTLDGGCADLDGASATPDLPLAGCAHRVAGVPLRLDLTAVAVGVHRLQIRLADGAGNETDIYDGQLAVAAPSKPLIPTVHLTVGDPRAASRPVSGGSASAAGAVASCAFPRLSMVLDQRPLRVLRGRPVLRAHARYRFRGRLTCRVGRARRSAPRGTPVELLNRIGHRLFGVTGATTATGGFVTMILSYTSSRTLIFRHRSTSGATRVLIPITVVRSRGR